MTTQHPFGDNLRFTVPSEGLSRFSSFFCTQQLLFTQNVFKKRAFLERYVREDVKSASFQSTADWKLDQVCVDAGLSESSLQLAFPGFWIGKAETDACGEPFLRGCPDCFEGDFHTALFQHSDLLHCPVHSAELTDRCSNCSAMRPYSTKGLVTQTTFHCHCRKTEWTSVAATDRRRKWIQAMEEALLDYSTWFVLAKTSISVLRCEGPRNAPSKLLAGGGTSFRRLATDARALKLETLPPKAFRELRNARVVEVREMGPGVKIVNLTPSGSVLPTLVPRRNLANVWPQSPEEDNTLSGVALKRLTLFASANHGECRELRDQCQQPKPDLARVLGCTVMSALAVLEDVWSDGHYGERVLEYFERHMSEVLGVPGGAAALALELTGFQMAADISRVVSAAAYGGPREQRRRLLEIARGSIKSDYPSLHYSIAQHSDGSRNDYTLAALFDGDWEEEWASLCFVQEGHHAEVREVHRRLDEDAATLKSHLDSLRRRKP